LSVTLIHGQCVSVKLVALALMFYSVLLTMAADAKLFELSVHQLAARIQFEGVAQRDNVRTL
jgi:hypothetical protein